MSWFRQYRPKKVAGLHLEKIRTQLQTLMRSERWPQVFLLAGPKGTGKTSVARIIGAVLNDPVNSAMVDWLFLGKTKPKTLELKDPNETDQQNESIFSGQSFLVQEIDAASHRGIDDVRLLKERAQVLPQQGKISVFILDEVHMFTSEAFNALLKLLEEPPQTAVFILATTELHKIPATILSRCQLLQFHQASQAELMSALERIVQAEKIKADPAALKLIADSADGSFRDAVKYLEAAALEGEITVDSISQTKVGFSLISDLILEVVNKNEAGVVTQIQSLRETGMEPNYFIKELFKWLHHQLLMGLGINPGSPDITKEVAQFFLTQLSQAQLSQPSPLPFLTLELTLLEIIFKAKAKNQSSDPDKKPTVKAKSSTPVPSKVDNSALLKTPSPNPEPIDQVKTKSNQEIIQPQSPRRISDFLEKWQEYVTFVAEKNSTLGALLRSGKPKLNPAANQAQIGVFYPFHYEQLTLAKHIKLMEECAVAFFGGRIPFAFELQPSRPADEGKSTLAEAASAFGLS